MCKHCPLCKSNNLYFIDPIESRKKIKSLIEVTGIDNLPEEFKNIIGKLNLDQNLSTEEEIFYELHGKKIVCKTCGYTFYEKDDNSQIENMNATPVSKEEYYEHLRNRANNTDVVNFVLNNSLPIEKYYIEALDQLLDEFDEINKLNSLNVDKSNEDSGLVN